MWENFGPREYSKTINTYKDPDKKYYVGYINHGVLDTVEVNVDMLYIASNTHNSKFAILSLKVFKNKLCKLLNIYRSIPTGYVQKEYIQDNIFDAKVAYLNIQSLNKDIESIMESFALEYPHVYLSKMQNYNGTRSYVSPSYEDYLRKGN